MKKLGLIVTLLAASMLTACMGGGSGGGKKKTSSGDHQPGTKETQNKAIEMAKDYTLVAINGKNTLYEGEKPEIGRDKGNYHNDYLALTTKQLVKVKEGDNLLDIYVTLNWKFDEKDPFVKEAIDIDGEHKAIYFLYNETEEHDFPFNVTLTCDKADPVDMSFGVHLMTKNLKFDHYTIEQIYKPTATDDNFELVDPATGYYKPNNEGFTFTCVATEGEVVYTSPDGNWGLIADGDYVLQLYSGSNLDLNTTRYPALKVGNKVYVEAELGCYKGNLQVSYIFDISNTDADVKASTGYRNLTAADFDGKHYWQGGLMNTLRTVSATYNGNIKDRNGTAVSDPKSLAFNRFTFEVKVGEKVLTIAFDYHVDPSDQNCPVFDAFTDKLSKLSVGSSVTIKGSFRFNGPVDKGYNGNETSTNWNLVPFLQDHIA